MEMDKQKYAKSFGPTEGDRFKLADTNLVAEVEEDRIHPGDEAVFGGGKTLRDGMGQSQATRSDGALDTVVTNAVVMDPKIGIVKGDIGIRDGEIVGIGNAGNPNTMDNVDPELVVGPGTEAISGEGKIATPGLIDCHVHMICPQQIDEALSSGVTTFFGGGTGPAEGTKATTCTPGPWNIRKMLEATDDLPLNWGFLGKGNCSRPDPLHEQIAAGAFGLKIHEDWGSTPAVIDNALSVAEDEGVQVTIHTDTLNEAGYVQDTIDAIGGRGIHTYHTEGAGGGHAPDIMEIAGESNILPSSTNPSRPYTVNTLEEHLDMLMVCHHLDPDNPEDVAFAESRIRAETIAAEDVLHDMGVLSMIGSDSQAMGRVGEDTVRTFQTAHKMKEQRGPLESDSSRNDNNRILRYLAKICTNPAITHGVDHVIGSLESGNMADLVLWPIDRFAAKPSIVMKGGMIAWSEMGDPNASIPTPQPVQYRPMFGSSGKALKETSTVFLSKSGYENGVHEDLGLDKQAEPIENCRNVTKSDMVRNDTTPEIEIDPESYDVRVNGELADVPPAESLPLTQKYYSF